MKQRMKHFIILYKFCHKVEMNVTGSVVCVNLVVFRFTFILTEGILDTNLD